MQNRGFFITFEGNEGSGKSTQARLLAERLRAEGYDVLESQEPGGTPIGQKVRRVLLDAANRELSPTAELLLMFAARAQNVDQWILPALRDGRIVVSDRFTDSTLAYQGAGRGLGADLVMQVDRIACRGVVPDLTICVDIDVEKGLRRAHARNADTGSPETRLDEQEVEFYQKARTEYQRLAAEEPGRFRMIDGDRGLDAVAEDVWNVVQQVLVSRRA